MDYGMVTVCIFKINNIKKGIFKANANVHSVSDVRNDIVNYTVGDLILIFFFLALYLYF